MSHPIHFYTAKRTRFYNDPRFYPRVKLLCTGEWVNYVKEEAYANAVTVPRNVTCRKCLTILLPTAIETVRVMELAYDKALKAESQ